MDNTATLTIEVALYAIASFGFAILDDRNRPKLNYYERCAVFALWPILIPYSLYIKLTAYVREKHYIKSRDLDVIQSDINAALAVEDYELATKLRNELSMAQNRKAIHSNTTENGDH